MGKFYFHLRDGDRLTADDDGIDLPDLLAARHEAVQTARELLIDAIRASKESVPEAVVIADEEGRPLDTVPVAMVLPKPLKG